jgi:hypothetical protein
MFGLNRKSLKRVDDALVAFRQTVAQAILCEIDPGGQVYLYAEADIARIDLTILLRRHTGQLAALRPETLLKIHLRELWTQFHLARMPVWAAFGMVTDGSSQSELSYMYPDTIDDSVSFEIRSRRWLVRTAGVDALNALRDRDMFDLPVLVSDTDNSRRFMRYPLEQAIS